jgi:hypothetical protein
MEQYKNDYKKNEDDLLWEIHEIRHKLYQKWKDKPIEEHNEYIAKVYSKSKAKWDKENTKDQSHLHDPKLWTPQRIGKDI